MPTHPRVVRVPLADVASIELGSDGSSNGCGSGTSLPSEGTNCGSSQHELFRQHYFEEAVLWQRLPHSLPVSFADVEFSNARPGEPDAEDDVSNIGAVSPFSSAVDDMHHVDDGDDDDGAAVAQGAPSPDFTSRTTPPRVASDDGAATPGTVAELAPGLGSEPGTEPVTPTMCRIRVLKVTPSSLRRGELFVEPSPKVHFGLLDERLNKKGSDLRCALLARAIGTFNAQHRQVEEGEEPDDGNGDGSNGDHDAASASASSSDDSSGAAAGADPDATAVPRPLTSVGNNSAYSPFVIDDEPWDAAVMDAVAFEVPLSGRLTGEIAVMDVLLRCLLWLPPEQRALLAVSGASRGWRAAAKRLPQWCLVPQLRFPNKIVIAAQTAEHASFIDDGLCEWAGGEGVCTRPAYCAVMRARQAAHRGSRERLQMARRMERRAASRFSLLLTGLLALVAFAAMLGVGGLIAYWLARSSSGSYETRGVADDDGGDFAGAPIFFLSLLCAYVFYLLRANGVGRCFVGIRKSTKQRAVRWYAILAVFVGVTVHLTLPFGLVVNRVVHFDLVLSHVLDLTTETSELCDAGGRSSLEAVRTWPPPAYVKVSNIEEWSVVPWFRGAVNNASGTVGPFVRDPLREGGGDAEVNRTAIGPLAPHNKSLYRSLCDADALAVAEGPKWLAARLSTSEGVQALIDGAHQCNELFAIPDWKFGLMQPASALQAHRYVLLVPPASQQMACGGQLPPVAVFVSHERGEFHELMRRIKNGGGAVALTTTTFLRTAWRTSLFDVDVAYRDAGQTWFAETEGQSRLRNFRLFYNSTDVALRLAIAAMNLSAPDAAALFNRSQGRLQPLYADGSVRPDNRRYPWWLEEPERFQAALLWGPARVPLVVPHAAQDPAEERQQWVMRLYIIGGVGGFLIVTVTALAAAPSRLVASESLLAGAVALCVFLVNPLWPMAWGIGCQARNDPQVCLTNPSGITALIATGTTATLAVCIVCCRAVLGDDD